MLNSAKREAKVANLYKWRTVWEQVKNCDDEIKRDGCKFMLLELTKGMKSVKLLELKGK